MLRSLGLIATGWLLFATCSLPAAGAKPRSYDVVIYGGTSGGVAAADPGRPDGKSVVLIEPKQHLGGLTVSGLGSTDSGDKSVIGGLSATSTSGSKSTTRTTPPGSRKSGTTTSRSAPPTTPCGPSSRRSPRPPSRRCSAKSEVDIVLGEWLERENGVKKDGGRIVSITTKSGKTFAGKQFIDTTYEET